MNYDLRAIRPLAISEFYVLLALTTGNSHAYGLRAQIANLSLGSVQVSNGTLYPVLLKMAEDGFVDVHNEVPTGKSGALRTHYAISEWGIIRLKEELARLAFAMQVARHQGLLEDKEPLEILKLKAQVRWGR